MLRCASPWYLSPPSSFSAGSPVHFITAESLVSSPPFYPVNPQLRPLYYFILLQLTTAGLFPLIFLPLLHVFYTVDRALLSKTELSLFTPGSHGVPVMHWGLMTGPRDSWGSNTIPVVEWPQKLISVIASMVPYCSIIARGCCFREHRSTTTWSLSNDFLGKVNKG